MLGGLIVVALLGVVVGWRARAFYRLPEQVLLRGVRRLAVTPIEEIVAGRQVKVVAFLEFVAPMLEAPISGRKCAGWIVELFEVSEDERKPILKDGALGDFGLRSPTGALALVRAPHPYVAARQRVAFELDRQVTSGRSFGRAPSERQAQFLAKHSLSPDRSYCYYEGVLQGAEEITVVGVADREPDPKGASSYRDMAPTRVVFQREPMWISDGPATG